MRRLKPDTNFVARILHFPCIPTCFLKVGAIVDFSCSMALQALLPVGCGDFLFRLGKGNDGLKVDNPLVDHEKVSFMVSLMNLADQPLLTLIRAKSLVSLTNGGWGYQN